MRSGTMEVYTRRMRMVLDAIADRLDSDLDLEELAGVAFFSPFHFHRVFRGVVGESIGCLIRRLRLERAAVMLIEGTEPVGVIARRAGYESSVTFRRAFRAAFGETPARFGKLRTVVPVLPAPSGYHYHPGHGMQSFTPVHAAAIRNGGCGMEAKTVQRGSVRVLAVDHRGPYHTIGAAFDRLGMLLDDHGIDVSGEKWLAIFLDDPETVPAGELRSRACVTLAVGQEPPPGAPDLRPLEIPGGLYATTRYIGSYEGLPNAWNDLCGTWIPAHGLKPDAGLCFEVYERGCCEVSDPGELITDLFEPVRPVE